MIFSLLFSICRIYGYCSASSITSYGYYGDDYWILIFIKKQNLTLLFLFVWPRGLPWWRLITPGSKTLTFFDEFWFESHSSNAIDFAVDIVIRVYKPDVSDFCSLFYDSSLKFEVFDYNNRISVLELISIAIKDDKAFRVRFFIFFSCEITVGANSHLSVFIWKFKLTVWADW